MELGFRMEKVEVENGKRADTDAVLDRLDGWLRINAAERRKERDSGRVQVEILYNETGRITRAMVTETHLIFQAPTAT